MTEKDVFIRKASGLTRVVSPLEAFIYSVCAPGPIYIVGMAVWMVYLYPGLNLPLTVIYPLALLPTMAVYYLFSVSMPRSGGEYVYVSRSLTPSLGFFVSWALSITSISWAGADLSLYAVNWGLASGFINQGLLTGNQGLIDYGMMLTQSNITVFAIAVILLVFCVAIMLWGTRPVMAVSAIALVAGLLMLVSLTIAFAQTTPEIFASRLQSLSGISYDSMIQRAKELGYATGWNWPATTMAGLTYINLTVLGNTYAANIAGEVKEVRKAQMLAMFGSVFFFMIYWFILLYPSWIIPGSEFWGALGTLWAANESPFLWFPFGVQLIVYMTDNPVLVHLAWIGWFVATVGSSIGLLFAPIRNMFAWSFDRVIPTSIARVDRRGSPYLATILGGLIALFFIAIMIFTPLMQYQAYSIVTWFLGWTVLGIAAMAFPFRRRDIFEKSPGIVRMKVLGVPVITIMGLLTTIVSAWTVYVMASPGFSDLLQLKNLAASVGTLVIVPFIIFAIAYAYNKSKGIPVDQQFREVPPD